MNPDHPGDMALCVNRIAELGVPWICLVTTIMQDAFYSTRMYRDFRNTPSDDELIDIATVQDGGLIEFQPITYDRAGVHHYYISEAVGSDVEINYDTHVEAVTVTVTENDDGGLDVDVDMDENEILFENVLCYN